MIKLGSKGNEVKELQRKLNLLDDGIFGKLTEEAVISFLKANGLVADGIVGLKTLDALNKTLKSNRKIKEIILHCSATAEGKDFTVADIKKWHLARGFNDIGYHYVIYRDGTVHQGRELNVSGAHCTGHNSNSIGICYIGGVATDNKTPKDTRTSSLKTSLNRLVKELFGRYLLSLDNVYCHYLFANKACPSFKIELFKKEF